MTTFGAARPAEIRALNGARAFPPLVLVLFHFSEGHGYRHFWPLDYLAARGYLWVEFFFCLSGFILTYVYGPRLKALLTLRGYGEFLRARLIRLYPLHLFMLAAILILVVTTRHFAAEGGYHSIFDLKYHMDVSPKGFFLSLFLVQAWHTMDRLTWNWVSWFVSVEWALCLVFPLLLWLADGRIWRGVALVVAGVGGVLALDLTSHHGLDITYDWGVLRGLAEFAIGVGFAVFYRAWKPHDRLPAWAHSLIQIALVIALFYAIYDTGWSHTARDIWTALPMMALVLALAFDRGLVAAALKTRLPQVMGGWSYATYLGQTFGLLLIRVLEQRAYPPPATPVLGTSFAILAWWLEPVGLVIFCAAWGALIATLVEHPATAWLKHRLGRPKLLAREAPG